MVQGCGEGDLLKAINNKPVHNIGEFFKVTKTVKISQGALLDILRNGQPLYITLKDIPSLHDNFKKLFYSPSTKPDLNLHGAGAQIAFNNQAPAETAEAAAANANTTAPTNSQLPSPKEQGAAQKELVEGHWLGMETIPLVPELAKEFNIPPDIKGVLVDEVSLESAESGILAGDMVVAVDGFATPDLYAFTEATRRVKNRLKAKVLVSRRKLLLEFIMSSTRTLGFSQNESAQPIRPGAISPHRSRGKACTVCHIIMLTGGQLPIDAGDILPNPPPIIKGAVAPHEYRGKCNTCHVILKDVAQIMRFSTVLKIIAGIVVLIMMVFFVFENLDPVMIWIPLFKGRHIGLIYIIMLFYILGMTSSFWIMTMLGIKRKKMMKLAEIPDSEQSLFEDEA